MVSDLVVEKAGLKAASMVLMKAARKEMNWAACLELKLVDWMELMKADSSAYNLAFCWAGLKAGYSVDLTVIMKVVRREQSSVEYSDWNWADLMVLNSVVLMDAELGLVTVDLKAERWAGKTV